MGSSLLPCVLTASPARPADLKKCMRAIFGQFGPIIDVVSRRTYRLRGQAWVVFEKAEDAQRAMESMQGFPFFDKPIVSMWLAVRREGGGALAQWGCHSAACSLTAGAAATPPPLLLHGLRPASQKIALAKTKSDAVAKMDGSLTEEDKLARQVRPLAGWLAC